MDAAHLHLMINHFPLIGLFFGVLIYCFGLFQKNESYNRAGLMVVVITGLFAIPTFLTGEPAEKIIEHAPSFSENSIEAHEEAAEIAIWIIEITAVASLAGLFLSIQQGTIPKPLSYGIVLLAVFSLVAAARTNNLGGKISHLELREPNTSVSPATSKKNDD